MKKYMLVLVSALLIAGCSSAPDCGSSDAQQMVRESIQESAAVMNFPTIAIQINTIVNKRVNEIIDQYKDASEQNIADVMGKAIAQLNAYAKSAKIEFTDIVTTAKDKDTGNVQCRARVKAQLEDNVPANGVVYYTIEATSNGSIDGTISDFRENGY